VVTEPKYRDGNNERGEIVEILEGWKNAGLNLEGLRIDSHHAFISRSFAGFVVPLLLPWLP
jgi:hypothetical protein